MVVEHLLRSCQETQVLKQKEEENQHDKTKRTLCRVADILKMIINVFLNMLLCFLLFEIPTTFLRDYCKSSVNFYLNITAANLIFFMSFIH